MLVVKAVDITVEPLMREELDTFWAMDRAMDRGHAGGQSRGHRRGAVNERRIRHFLWMIAFSLPVHCSPIAHAIG
ncbi:hypothetical protein CEXT_744971 [Caerostris extrusa]|uniref:Uncharacterized protein n=1 Tax=Caerostris extrusa TaxID=172846 RepID=A0AAV4NVV0_CAEEX|nr:hypothetical protein CEXT_744971 [Caerostris extrusa]